MRLRKIISGGQTGADQGGLAAAKQLGLETGGWAPANFETECGPMWDLLQGEYGLAVVDGGYISRTKANVRDADATLIFMPRRSPGSLFTATEAKRLGRAHLLIAADESHWTNLIIHFLKQYDPEVLNVAGNRKSKCPTIEDSVRTHMVEAINNLRTST